MHIQQCHASAASALSIAMNSGCPSSQWLDTAVGPVIVGARAHSFVYINVGANKGFNIATMLHRFGNSSIDAGSWWHAFNIYLKLTHQRTPRGVAMGACNGAQVGKHAERPIVLANMMVEAHALELLPSNSAWLQWATDHFGITDAVRVVNAGVSNVANVIEVQNCIGRSVGWERASLDDFGTARPPPSASFAAAASSSRPVPAQANDLSGDVTALGAALFNRTCGCAMRVVDLRTLQIRRACLQTASATNATVVPIITLDQYAAREQVPSIDFLSIDAEG